ncbi:MAG: hypothetical protein Q7T88_11145 [Methylotenera sp.]|nr:hypothetical protein [Methylotenera sp.]
MALIMLLIVAGLASVGLILSSLDSVDIKNKRDKKTSEALSEAKDALIGYVSRSSDLSTVSHLPNPDLRVNATFSEGVQAGSIGSENISLAGRFPWRSLGVTPIKDGYDECLWYVASGRLKSNPTSTDSFNWDTKGQIDVIDGAGSFLYKNLAALVVSAGPSLGSQDRSNVDSELVQCGGNYDVRNYLDTYNAVDSVLGSVNYFPDSTNNRQASDTANKRFVFTQNANYNDRIIGVSIEELFKPILRRSDFSSKVSELMNDPVFASPTLILDGSKGTDNVVCTTTFCNNWREMLFLTELPVPSSIQIDGVLTAVVCKRVLIFSGQKTSTQLRVTDVEKSDPNNYLEAENLTSFNVPIASEVTFSGLSAFNPNSPTADVLRCIE